MEKKNEIGISYVVMPFEILKDKELTSNEKILYCYLSIFKSGVCFQSNAKLAEITGIDESTVKRALKKLSDKKYVFIEFVNNNSALRRIYVVLENPKKLEYLSRKGMFSLDRTSVSEPKENPEPACAKNAQVPKKMSEPVSNSRPFRRNYNSDEEYEKALYGWNTTSCRKF